MSTPKDTTKAGTATSGKASGSAPAETGENAAYLAGLIAEADAAGGWFISLLELFLLGA